MDKHWQVALDHVSDKAAQQTEELEKLKEENQKLAEENNQLREELFDLKATKEARNSRG